MRPVILAALWLGVAVMVSGQGSNAWPIDTLGAGGFSAKRLAAAPAIDGRQWFEADVKVGGSAPWRPPKAAYTLRFTDMDEEGDLQRWALMVERQGTRPAADNWRQDRLRLLPQPGEKGSETWQGRASPIPAARRG